MNISLTAIRAFDAVVRTSSFSKAADFLGVTPTAVSHQIKQLEERLGRQLFVRSTRSVALSEEGLALSQEVCPALKTINDAIDTRLTQPAIKTVSLGVSSLFASRWLVPRLGAFLQEHPEIDLALHHSVLPVWQQAERYDICIEWGTGNWEGLQAKLLYSVHVSPVASPTLLDTMDNAGGATALLHAPLLHYRNTQGWRSWFDAQGVQTDQRIRGLVLEDANVELQAAIDGKGISLGVFPFIEPELQAEKLVRLFPGAFQPREGYYMVERKSQSQERHVEAFRHWLLKTVKTENESDMPAHT